MLIPFILSRLRRHRRQPRFCWRPALDLRDPVLYSTLLPASLS